jgi:hypothetical protein
MSNLLFPSGDVTLNSFLDQAGLDRLLGIEDVLEPTIFDMDDPFDTWIPEILACSRDAERDVRVIERLFDFGGPNIFSDIKALYTSLYIEDGLNISHVPKPEQFFFQVLPIPFFGEHLHIIVFPEIDMTMVCTCPSHFSVPADGDVDVPVYCQVTRVYRVNCSFIGSLRDSNLYPFFSAVTSPKCLPLIATHDVRNWEAWNLRSRHFWVDQFIHDPLTLPVLYKGRINPLSFPRFDFGLCLFKIAGVCGEEQDTVVDVISALVQGYVPNDNDDLGLTVDTLRIMATSGVMLMPAQTVVRGFPKGLDIPEGHSYLNYNEFHWVDFTDEDKEDDEEFLAQAFGSLVHFETDGLLDIVATLDFESQSFWNVGVNDAQFNLAHAQINDLNENLRAINEEGVRHSLDDDQFNEISAILRSVNDTITNLSQTATSLGGSLANSGPFLKMFALVAATAFCVYKAVTTENKLWVGAMSLMGATCTVVLKKEIAQFIVKLVDGVRDYFDLPRSQGLTEMGGLVKTLIVGCVSYELLGQVPSSKNIVAFGKRMADLPKTFEGYDAFITYLHQAFVKAMNFVQANILGMDVEEFMKVEVPKVDAWCEAVIALAKEQHDGTLALTVANSKRVFGLESEYLRLSKEVYTGIESHRVRLALANYYAVLRKVVVIFERANFRKTGYRQVPLGILFMSAPGVGKTMMVWPLAIRLLKRILPPEQLPNLKNEYPNYLYARQPENEYWEGYNGQPIVFHDDFGQKRDVVGDGTEPFEIIREINSAPMVTHQADIESKGNKMFNAQVVIATTNQIGFTFESVNAPSAVTRRFPMTYRPIVKEEYAVPGEVDPYKRVIDVTHPYVRSEGGRPKHDLLEIEKIKWEDAKHFKIVKTMTFQEVEDECDAALAALIDEADMLKDYLEDLCSTPVVSQADEPARAFLHPDVQAALREYMRRGGQEPPDVVTLEDILGGEEEPEPASNIAQFLVGLQTEDVDAYYDFVTEFMPHYRMAPAMTALFETILRNEVAYDHTTDTLHARNRRLVASIRLLHQRMLVSATARIRVVHAVDSRLTNRWNATYNQLRSAKDALVSWVSQLLDRIYAAFNHLYAAEARFERHLLVHWPTFYVAWTSLKAFVASFVVFSLVFRGLFMYLEWLNERNVKAMERELDKKEPDPEFDEALEELLAESSHKDKAHNRAKKAEAKARTKKNDDEIFFQAGGDVNLMEMMTKISGTNLYTMYYPEADGYSEDKAGQLIVVSGHAALLPHHYRDKFLSAIENGSWTAEFKIKLVSPMASFEVPVKYFLKSYRTEHFELNDLYMFELPKTMPTHANILKYFCTDLQFSKMVSVYAGLWLNYGKWKYNPNMKIAISKHSPLKVSTGTTTIDLWDSLFYRCSTRAGDCGSLLTINDKSMGPGKILGVHVAGTSAKHDVAIGMASKLSREDVQACLDLMSKQIPVPEMSSECLPIQKYSQGFPLLAQSPRPVLGSPETEWIRTSMHGLWSKSKKRPARLKPFRGDDGVEIDPRFNAIQKYRRSLPRSVVDPPLQPVRVAAVLYMQHCFGVAQYEKQDVRGVLSMEDACYGIDGEAFLDAIPKGTSPGYPYILENHVGYAGKTFWLGKDEDRFGPGWGKLKQDVDALIDDARNGVRSTVVFADFLKDELREKEKVRIGKTRLISGSPLHYLVAFRMYFLDFMAWMRRARIQNFTAVGMNPYSVEWEVLSKKLSSKGPKVFDGDFAGLDTSHFYELFVLYAKFANKYYGDGDENARIRFMLMEHAAYSIHVVGDEMYLWSCVEPSGFPATTDFNSFAVNVLLIACWLDLNPQGYKGGHDYFHHVYAVVFGDDNVVNISDECSTFFNQKTVVKAMSVFGYEYTDAQKNKDPAEFKDLDSCTFLKRSFRYEPIVGRRVCPLELDTILEMPYWCRRGINRHEAEIQTIDIALRELSLHGPETWRRYSHAFLEAAKDHLAHISEFEDRVDTLHRTLDEVMRW